MSIMTQHTYTQEAIMPNSKSGFEIRAGLLAQAQGLLEQNAQRKVDAYYAAVEQSTTRPVDIAYPELEITTGKVIETARQLNTFVNEK